MRHPNYQLVLRSADIPNLDFSDAQVAKYTSNLPTDRLFPYENQNYKINAEQTDMTFKNINLRSILGNSYKDGDYYNMKVNSVVFGLTPNGSTYATTENDRVFNIELRGLPFLSSYQNNASYSDRVILATVRVPSGANANIFTYVNREISFMIDRNQTNATCDLRISYRDVETGNVLPNTALALGTNYPNLTLNLSFYKI